MNTMNPHDLSGSRFPESGPDRWGFDRLRWTPFGGRGEDVEVDFTQPARPCLVTEILKSHVTDKKNGELSGDFFWNLPQGMRIAWLFILAGSEDGDDFCISLQCREGPCREKMEVHLSAAEVLSLFPPPGADGEQSIEFSLGEKRFCFRVPTGNDLREWHRLGLSVCPPGESRMAMIRTLHIPREGEPPLPDAWDETDCRRLDDLFKRADPLIDFDLQVICPLCARENSFSLDLEALLLDHLQKRQERLLDAVHRLACIYHWAESEILRLPCRRREYYLSRIAREVLE